MNNGLPGPSTTDTITGGKTQELSSYDRIRKPHRRVTETSTTIAIGPRTLSAELTCPICLDLLTNTMTTKECLHRFCEECIKNALMRGNKECPTCRNKIVSKRSLRHDTNFDALINKIWPDRREYERMQEASFSSFQEQSNISALQKSIEAGMKAQAATRRMRVQGSYDYEKRKRRVGSTANGAGANGGTSLMADEAVGEEDVELPTGAAGALISETSDTDSDSSDSSDLSGSDSRSSDERSITSALSSASEARPAEASSARALPSRVKAPVPKRQSVVRPPSTSSSLNDKMSKWMKDNAKCNSPLVDDGMEDTATSPYSRRKIFDPRLLAMRQDCEEIDVLLTPAKSLLQRATSNHNSNFNGDVAPLPSALLKSHFVRMAPDITVEQIIEYLQQQVQQSNADVDMTNEDAAALSASSVELMKPSYLYFVNWKNEVCKVFPRAPVYSVFITSQLTDGHVRIFYDTQPPEVDSEGLMVTEIVEESLLVA